MIGPAKAGRLTVRPADPTDIGDLAPRLRPWDLIECLAHGLDPATAMMLPFENGYGPLTWALEQDGALIAIGGLHPLDPLPGAAIWLVGTEALDSAGTALLALSRPWAAACLARYTPLVNVVPARCETTIRWLRWVGFDIEPAFVHLRGVRFVRFRMDRQDGPNSASAPA